MRSGTTIPEGGQALGARGDPTSVCPPTPSAVPDGMAQEAGRMPGGSRPAKTRVTVGRPAPVASLAGAGFAEWWQPGLAGPAFAVGAR